MIDLDSRRAQSTVHGFRWHDAQSSARARRDTPGYKVSLLPLLAGDERKMGAKWQRRM
jgi:hypothetical protein